MHASKMQFESLESLKNRADFVRAQKAGKKWVAKGLVIESVENGLGTVRFGLTVSKRISKSAVIRNRVRRRLRAAAREILPLHARPGFDIVLIGRAETAKRPHKQLKEDLRWCLEKLELLKERA